MIIIAATVESIANPTRQALIPLLVPRSELPAASTINLIGFHVASVGGPALGGLLIAWLGVGAAYLIDTISFVAVIVAVIAMHARPVLPPLAIGGFAAALEGFRFLRGSPVLLGVMITDFLATFFGVSTALMPIFAEQVLDAGPRGLGLLLAAPALGAVISAVVLGFTNMPNRAGLVVLISVAAYRRLYHRIRFEHNALDLARFPGREWGGRFRLDDARHGMRAILTPDPLRGRVAAVNRTLAAGGPQIGEFEKGVLASFVGAGPAVAAGGVATMLTAAVIARVYPKSAAQAFVGDCVGTRPARAGSGSRYAD